LPSRIIIIIKCLLRVTEEERERERVGKCMCVCNRKMTNRNI